MGRGSVPALSKGPGERGLPKARISRRQPTFGLAFGGTGSRRALPRRRSGRDNVRRSGSGASRGRSAARDREGCPLCRLGPRRQEPRGRTPRGRKDSARVSARARASTKPTASSPTRASRRGAICVAFLDHPTRGDNSGTLAVVDRAGARQSLGGKWAAVEGLAWHPRRGEIWIGATKEREARAVWAVSLSGRERVVASAPGQPRGSGRFPRRQASRDAGLDADRHNGASRGDAAERDLSWLDASFLTAPRGRRFGDPLYAIRPDRRCRVHGVPAPARRRQPDAAGGRLYAGAVAGQESRALGRLPVAAQALPLPTGRPGPASRRR